MQGWPLTAVAASAAVCMPLAAMPAYADAPLRCGSQVIDAGLDMAAVQARCGEPDYRDPWPQPAPGTPAWAGAVEEWTYNFGPNRLLSILHFLRGKLTRIDSDGYGFAPDSPPACDTALQAGAGKYRLLQACGAPQQRTAYYNWQPLVPSASAAVASVQLVWRERWIYDFGARRLPRRLDLQDARVTDVDVLMRMPP